MAVTAAAALQGIASRFQVDGLVVAVQPHGSGHINSSYRVRCRSAAVESSYLLQRINTAVFADPAALMENIGRVTAHLHAKVADESNADRRVLTPVAAHDGELLHREDDGSCWRMYRFLERTTTYDRVESAEQARMAARAFGEFQQQLADLPAPRLHETIPHFHDTPQRFRAFQRAVDADVANRAAMCAPEIAFLQHREPLAGALLRAGLPERVCHNDTKLNNVLFDTSTGQPLCVVDLDTVMPGLALYDLGDMVRTATCPAAEDEEDLSLLEMQMPLYRALLEGYAAGAGDFLTGAERTHLHLAGAVITYEQALRFLADHLAGDVYYKTSRPSHNLQRCRTQIALLESMERQAAAMQALTATVFAEGHRP